MKTEGARKKWLGVVVRQAPANFPKVEEALRLAVAAASRDVRVDVALVGDGVGLVRPSVPMNSAELFDVENMLEMFSRLGGSLVAECEAIPEAERSALRLEAQLMPCAELLRRLTERDFSLVF